MRDYGNPQANNSPGDLLYLDCFSGISGDMFLGSLLDLGLSLEELQEKLSYLEVSGYRLQSRKITRYGISGTGFEVIIKEAPPVRRPADIDNIIHKSDLAQKVKERSLQAFRLLGEAESSVHGVPPEEVHFHEIGAVDTVVDIVGGVVALDLLGIEKVISSPVPLGRGQVEMEHGTYPLPAPATAALLAKMNLPVYGVESVGELVTPTGAVLLAVLVDEFGEMPYFYPRAVGYGLGKKDFGYPNLLRAWVGAAQQGRELLNLEEESAEIIEANIDDLSPEIAGHVLQKLLQEGALDAYYTPVQMKKSRPGIKLSIISPPYLSGRLVELVFRETSTLGCRITESRKIMLPRRVDKVETPWGTVRVKVAGEKGEIRHFSPEYEDCLEISKRQAVPLKDIYRQVEINFFMKDKPHNG